MTAVARAGRSPRRASPCSFVALGLAFGLVGGTVLGAIYGSVITSVLAVFTEDDLGLADLRSLAEGGLGLGAAIGAVMGVVLGLTAGIVLAFWARLDSVDDRTEAEAIPRIAATTAAIAGSMFALLLFPFGIGGYVIAVVFARWAGRMTARLRARSRHTTLGAP